MNIFENPFYILGVSPHDNRRAIAAAADDKLFLSDSAVINDARNALLIPEKRLAAEMRWFPGTDDRKIAEIIEFFNKLKAGQRTNMIDMSGLKGIALLNFSIYVFNFRKFRDVKEIIKSMLTIILCFETIEQKYVFDIVNQTHKNAAFSEVEKLEFEEEFDNYRNDIVKTMDEKINKLSSGEYAAIIRELADIYSSKKLIENINISYTNDDGSNVFAHGSREKYKSDEREIYRNSFIIGDLLNNRALKNMQSLEAQKNIILSLAANCPTDIDKLASNLKIWEELAYPLIAISQNSGMEDQNLCDQAWGIIHAVRKNCERFFSNPQKSRFDKINYALNLTYILQENLSEVSSKIAKILSQDIEDLKKLNKDAENKIPAGVGFSHFEDIKTAMENENKQFIMKIKFIAALIVFAISLIYSFWTSEKNSSSTRNASNNNSKTYKNQNQNQISSSSSSFSSSRAARDNRRKDLNIQLMLLKGEIEKTKTELDNMENELNLMKSNIDNYRTNYELFHSESERLLYNSEIDLYNSYIIEYNALLKKHKSYIEEYNSMVDEYNSLRY